MGRDNRRLRRPGSACRARLVNDGGPAGKLKAEEGRGPFISANLVARVFASISRPGRNLPQAFSVNDFRGMN
jgi:hypothetical protein